MKFEKEKVEAGKKSLVTVYLQIKSWGRKKIFGNCLFSNKNLGI